MTSSGSASNDRAPAGSLAVDSGAAVGDRPLLTLTHRITGRLRPGRRDRRVGQWTLNQPLTRQLSRLRSWPAHAIPADARTRTQANKALLVPCALAGSRRYVSGASRLAVFWQWSERFVRETPLKRTGGNNRRYGKSLRRNVFKSFQRGHVDTVADHNRIRQYHRVNRDDTASGHEHLSCQRRMPRRAGTGTPPPAHHDPGYRLYPRQLPKWSKQWYYPPQVNRSASMGTSNLCSANATASPCSSFSISGTTVTSPSMRMPSSLDYEPGRCPATDHGPQRRSRYFNDGSTPASSADEISLPDGRQQSARPPSGHAFVSSRTLTPSQTETTPRTAAGLACVLHRQRRPDVVMGQ